MFKLELEDFEFREDEEHIRFIFMKHYYFLVEKNELEKIGSHIVSRDYIEFDAPEKSVDNKTNRLLSKGMGELKSVLGKKTVYIHKDSGIPLMGTNEFGIVDRNTSIVELKPHTLCNLNCIYCSVDAGRSSKKTCEFLIEEEYLVEEFKKIISCKERPVEASINPQGEPLMYARIFDLIKDVNALNKVEIVSINTNGALLTEKMIDKLVEAGLGRINLSLNTLDQETASKLADSFYPLENVKKIVSYCKNKIDILIAPLIVPGYNDHHMEDLVKFCKENKHIQLVGFQNFLEYQRGRNPVKSKPMDNFMETLKKLEEKHGVKLIHKAEDFNIYQDKQIPKPFKKKDAVEVNIICEGKYPREFIGVSQGRCITISGNVKIGSRIKAKIVRDKHNIFRGTL